MKAGFFVFLFVLGYIECRKTYTPIDKNANTAFINMEGGAGGGNKPAPNVQPIKPQAPTVQPTKPASGSAPSPMPTMKPPHVTRAPSVTPPAPVKPTPLPVKPSPPTLIKPSIPVPSTPVSTPGPGSVKQLVNYYDSQGKASVIRPYSYSQAVKQG